MNCLGNIVWLLLGGLISAALYFVEGLVLCVTIIGIPFGLKIMQLGALSLWPFGREVATNPTSGCFTTLANIIWILLGWWEVALVHLVFGVILCITIVGIPFGKQHFKIAGYSLFPFGCEIS